MHRLLGLVLDPRDAETVEQDHRFALENLFWNVVLIRTISKVCMGDKNEWYEAVNLDSLAEGDVMVPCLVTYLVPGRQSKVVVGGTCPHLALSWLQLSCNFSFHQHSVCIVFQPSFAQITFYTLALTCPHCWPLIKHPHLILRFNYISNWVFWLINHFSICLQPVSTYIFHVFRTRLWQCTKNCLSSLFRSWVKDFESFIHETSCSFSIFLNVVFVI